MLRLLIEVKGHIAKGTRTKKKRVAQINTLLSSPDRIGIQCGDDELHALAIYESLVVRSVNSPRERVG